MHVCFTYEKKNTTNEDVLDQVLREM